MKTVTVILAGGKSSRMGRDKALLPVGGRPLLAVQAERWRGVFDALVISAPCTDRAGALAVFDQLRETNGNLPAYITDTEWA